MSSSGAAIQLPFACVSNTSPGNRNPSLATYACDRTRAPSPSSRVSGTNVSSGISVSALYAPLGVLDAKHAPSAPIWYCIAGVAMSASSS